MSDLHHSIVGLTRSGKTTYLAALWHLIDSGEVTTELVLDRLVGDHGHLNEIVDDWRRCVEVPRTSIAAETNVAIHFRVTASGRRFVLTFPDLSGESFRQQVEKRTCSKGYLDGFAGDGGVMLFITADRVTDGLTILEVQKTLDHSSPEESSKDQREWSPELVPEQVRLVELLQFIQEPPFNQSKRRLAVIVSAWDVVLPQHISPDEWLHREMPLLHQFLQSNGASWEVRVYGVSAQGGSVKGDERDSLLAMTPSKRIRCVGPDTRIHDLTSPIIWLSDGG